jgi:hypothetical protein
MDDPASDREPPSPVARVWSGWGTFGVAILLAIHVALALSSARKTSITVDELGHLPSGYYYLRTGDARYCSLNPPLVNALSALPVLLLDLPPRPAPPPSDDPFSFWPTGYRFLELYRTDYLRIFAVARCVPVLVVLALGILLCVWARRLASEAPDLAGVLAVGFFCLSPNVLAHSPLVGTDTGTAFFVSFALWMLRGLLRRPALAPTLLYGAALGLAQLAKAYALLLYPTSVLVALAWHRLSPPPRPGPRRLFGCLLGAMGVSLLVLNTGYLWGGFGASLSELPLQSGWLASWRATALGALPLPLPAAYLRALDGQLVELRSGIPSYLFGETFQGGRWYYYPALLAIKAPIPLLVAFGLALALSVPRPRVPGRELILLASYPLLLLLVLSLGEGRQLGARSLLSAAPLVQLWVAVTLARSGPRRWPVAAGGVVLVSLLAISLRAHPDYLAYFNAFVGGSRRGYLYASEANLDLGQDLLRLAEYLEAEGAESVQLLYFGSVDPALYGIQYEVPKGPPRPGLVAVSVSLYRMAYPVYDHGELRLVGPVTVGTAEPIASIGGSIHVYRVPEAPPR